MNIRVLSKHLFVGVSVPAVLLINAFFVPEPYSHPLINVGLAPAKLMPFLENRELMGTLTHFVFGKMTPNFAPMSLIILAVFWFIASVSVSVSVVYIKRNFKRA